MLCHLQVLLGPFVDAEQPLIAGGMIDVTFQQLFQTQVGVPCMQALAIIGQPSQHAQPAKQT